MVEHTTGLKLSTTTALMIVLNTNSTLIIPYPSNKISSRKIFPNSLQNRGKYTIFSSRVSNSQTGIVFLDAPGETGKSLLINLILAHVRSQQTIAIAAASNGITATILNGGQTLHSTFKVTLDVHMHDMPTCAIKNCFLWQISL